MTRIRIYSILLHIVEYAKYLSVPDHMEFYALSVMNAAGVLGRTYLAGSAVFTS